LKSPVRSVNRKDILKKVWGATSVHPKTVDVHLYNLRRKLDPLGFQITSHGPGQWKLLQKEKS
jgi:DNA-binding winged helix-turn-helix (wHTH) protein